MCRFFFFSQNYVIASRRAKWLFLGFWKAVTTTLLVEIRLCMIRNNLIIQGFKMDNFALRNKIENPNHFGTYFNFGGTRAFVRLNMEIDLYCHLLASKPYDHNLRFFEQPYNMGRQDYPINTNKVLNIYCKTIIGFLFFIPIRLLQKSIRVDK